MKKLITLSFCLCIVSLTAQTNADDYYNGSKPKLLAKDRVSASISAGTGVSFFNNSKTTGYTSFVAPKIGYQLTGKFKLNIGLMHYTMTGNTFMALNQNESFINNSTRSISGNLIFAEGRYRLNNRTILSGAVMMDANNYNRKNNFKAASFGLDYKVSKHSSIGFRATVSQGSSDNYFIPQPGRNNYNPFSQSSWGISPLSPMGTDGFNSSFR